MNCKQREVLTITSFDRECLLKLIQLLVEEILYFNFIFMEYWYLMLKVQRTSIIVSRRGIVNN